VGGAHDVPGAEGGVREGDVVELVRIHSGGAVSLGHGQALRALC
jgi:hypothetical protein